MGFIFLLSLFSFVVVALSAPEDEISAVIPKLKDYAEQTRISSAYPESKVRITVGEANGFAYTASGRTYSPQRISVSGEYFNNEIARDGYAWLFLATEPGISFYHVNFIGNSLFVQVKNFHLDLFEFEVIPPTIVPVHSLRISQINATALLVSGPSRSYLYHPKGTKDNGSSIQKTEGPVQNPT